MPLWGGRSRRIMSQPGSYVKRYLLLSFHLTPLLLVATFSIGLMLALKAGLAGLPLALLLQSWFFKYCFVFLDAIVAGRDEPPVLDIDMVNPVSEQRPLILALLVMAEGLLLVYLRQHVGPVPAVGAGVVLIWILPANIALLGITRNPFQAIWPPMLVALISALGRTYFLLNIGLLVAAGAMYAIATHAPSILFLFVTSQWVFLLTFALLGGALFEHRLELGLDSKTRREQLAERDSREHAAERGQMLDRAHSKFRVRKPGEGWEHIETWLRTCCGTAGANSDACVSEYRAVLEATSKWEDVRPADRLANELVSLLLAKRANGEALRIVEQRLATHVQFQIVPPAQAVRIAELAGAAGKRALQRRITGR